MAYQHLIESLPETYLKKLFAVYQTALTTLLRDSKCKSKPKSKSKSKAKTHEKRAGRERGARVSRSDLTPLEINKALRKASGHAEERLVNMVALRSMKQARYAEENLVALPEELDYATAAALGCRFTTAYRAVVARGRLEAGEWVAVHGCGGVGLSAIMIARSLNARVVAVDVNPAALELATELGAERVVDGRGDGRGDDVAAAIVEATGGGAHLSLDALGHPAILWNSVS